MQKGGRVVRDKTQSAGEKVGGAIDNARIVTVINGKFVADSDLSALKINVDADNGVVTLKGTVKSLDAVGKAMALALDTDGVHQVVSLLTVENP
jgi:osmotically-inducible protein OsmY